MKLNLKLIIIFTIGLFFSNCEKDNDKTIPKYEMSYTIRNCGDDTLTSMIVHTQTFFPNENITELIGSGKFKNDYYYNYDQDNYLFSNDSLKIITTNKVYFGCTKSLTILLRFNENKNLITVRKYTFLSDTITNTNDCKFTFEWPLDSDKYEYEQHSYTIK